MSVRVTVYVCLLIGMRARVSVIIVLIYLLIMLLSTHLAPCHVLHNMIHNAI